MDVFEGTDDLVCDGDTVGVRITWEHPSNHYGYQPFEFVRFANVDAPELNKAKGQLAAMLTRRYFLLGREVICFVYARDVYGRPVAEVYPVLGLARNLGVHATSGSQELLTFYRRQYCPGR